MIYVKRDIKRLILLFFSIGMMIVVGLYLIPLFWNSNEMFPPKQFLYIAIVGEIYFMWHLLFIVLEFTKLKIPYFQFNENNVTFEKETIKISDIKKVEICYVWNALRLESLPTVKFILKDNGVNYILLDVGVDRQKVSEFKQFLLSKNIEVQGIVHSNKSDLEKIIRDKGYKEWKKSNGGR
jgi:hypothetical protein